jgi:nucleoporin p58/p45
MTNHGDSLAHLPNDTELLTHRLTTLNSALENDALAISQVRELTASDAADARLSFRAVDNLKLPPQYHHHPAAGGGSSSLHWNSNATSAGAPSSTSAAAADLPGQASASALGVDDDSPKDLVSYFSARASAMANALDNYTRTVAAIESHLRGIEARTAQQTQQLLMQQSQASGRGYMNGMGGREGRKDGEGSLADEKVRELAAVLRDFEKGIFGVAGKIGGAREGVTELVLGGELGGDRRQHGFY